jgi:hypothetical protein
MTLEQQPDRVVRERIVTGQTARGVSGAQIAGGANNEYFTLKAREKELTSQREDLEERREELSQQLPGKEGVDKTGIEARITTLDQRLQQIEIDLNEVGREAAQAAPATIAVPEPRTIYRGYGEEDMFFAGVTGAFILLTLLSPFIYRSWRRRKRGAVPVATPAFGSERVDRMEQAIDSIAVEIERVSENQRFMTRLMTETQLAGTIAAVRGSTEAAKVAAEKSSNV